MSSQFSRSWVKPEFVDLLEEFPNILVTPSEEVKEMFAVYGGGKHDFPEKLEDCVNLRYGFEYGVGWKELTKSFLREIDTLLQKAKNNGHDLHYHTFILKEKFGSLRDQGTLSGEDRSLYFQEYRDISRKYEDMSTTVCEQCGNPGSIKKSGRGWVVTLCDECFAKVNKSKDE